MKENVIKNSINNPHRIIMKYLLISIVCVFYVCYSDGWRYARNDVIRGNIGVQHRIGVLHATSKGFASTPSSSSNHAKPVLQSHEDCVCQSKLKFGDCCGQVYVNRGLPFSATATTTTRQEDTTVENTTMSAIERLIRSRYTAYFLKHADYLIATTHPANKDYVKHMEKEGNIHKRAHKRWKDDLIRNNNNEQFEFLYFNIVRQDHPDDMKILLDKYPSIASWDESKVRTAKFQIIYRQRGLKTQMIPIEEISVFLEDSVPQHVIGAVGNLQERSPSKQWYYVHSVVSPMDANTLQELTPRLPMYESNKRIATRWE